MKYKQRREEIKRFGEDQIRMKEQIKQAKAKKLTEETERLTKEIVQIGHRSSSVEIVCQLDLLKGATKQRAALKLQLQFRQKVLGQHADKTLFHVTTGGRQKTLRDLRENLTKHVEAQHKIEITCSPQPVSTLTVVDYIANPRF